MSSRWRHDALECWTADAFSAAGVPREQAEMAAHMLVRSEMRGYRTHGLTRLPSYLDRLRASDFNPRPAMAHKSVPGGVVLDADGAMGQVAGPLAVRLGIEALETSASVLMVVRSCGHLGALGIYALLAAEAGVFCMVGQRTPPMMATQGFSRAAIGHNPIAFGCPMPGRPAIVFDIACSVAARGHILLAAREGRPIPEGWALDADGMPTTDAQRALEGPLLSMGGHKGIGIAMMVECLAGAMSATAESLDTPGNAIQRDGAAGRQGAFLWFVKPQAFAAQNHFSDYMAQWADNYLDAGGSAARLPGHRGDALEQQGYGQGVELPATLAMELAVLGQRLSLPFPAPTHPR